MAATKTKQGVMKRQEIYFFIVDYIKEHGYAPSYREIGEGVNLKSTSTVNMHITKMFAEGMLETDVDAFIDGIPGAVSSRAIRVPGYKFVKE